jgi:hypothetical protein
MGGHIAEFKGGKLVPEEKPGKIRINNRVV